MKKYVVHMEKVFPKSGCTMWILPYGMGFMLHVT